MLGKTSVSMMVLLVAASLIGISSIHQYVEGQPRAKLPQQLSAVGTVASVRMIDSPAGKACTAGLELAQGPNTLRLGPGTHIDLVASNEHFCTLFVLSKIGQTEIGITVQKIKATSLPPAVRGALAFPANHPQL
ncbi:MAG TPA: hypothetical protein VKA95_00540, partial [Nitrososphaeraceae archaeon]|nr:hypothetical protein [Nitrososphaeraceae archaeon]